MPWPLRLRSRTHNEQSRPSKAAIVAAATRGCFSQNPLSDSSDGSAGDHPSNACDNRRMSHVRSTSQPFPSLGSVKNSNRRDQGGAGEMGGRGHRRVASLDANFDPFLQMNDEESAIHARMALPGSPKGAWAPASSSHGRQDGLASAALAGSGREHRQSYYNGRALDKLRCMTCASFNTFPKSKKSFRCTKCGTINDLVPYTESSLNEPHSRKRDVMPWNRELHHGRAFNPLLTPANIRDKGRNPLLTPTRNSSDETSTDSANGASPSEALSSDASPPSPDSQNEINSTFPNKPQNLRIRFSATRSQAIFRPLINYLRTSFDGCDTLTSSFLTTKVRQNKDKDREPIQISQKEGKEPVDAKSHQRKTCSHGNDGCGEECGIFSTSRSSRIDWEKLNEWYLLIVNVGSTWQEVWERIRPDPECGPFEAQLAEVWRAIDVSTFGKEVEEARRYVRLALLRATEDVLVRPKRPLRTPDDVRFLLILLANPLLFPPDSAKDLLPAKQQSARQPNKPNPAHTEERAGDTSDPIKQLRHGSADDRDHHARITKRVLGILANLSPECHKVVCAWFSRYTGPQMQRLIDLVNRFITYRLTRDEKRKRHKANGEANINDFVPVLSSEGTTAAQLHDAISRVHISKPSEPSIHEPPSYIDDWQLHVASRAMALLFIANNNSKAKRLYGSHIVPLNAFYNTFFDYANMIADFEAWEARSGKYTVCQHSFLLSLFVKIRLLEFEAHRQMEEKARHAFFATVLTRTPESQYMMLKVRRQCLVEDSLTGVSQVVATGQEDIKKGLKIEFIGEEGVDAGGLRKEWFLLLTRDIFNPDHDLFLYDEDSHYAYFNPYCLESSEQFYLVGVLLGLAIYNSTILDIALPPFLFRKLLAAAPRALISPSTVAPVQTFKPTLEDLAEYRPSVAQGLQRLLEYEGDARDLCLDFVIETERYGERVVTLLCPNGDRRSVTNSNKKEYVNLYIRHLLVDSVARQFDPFRNGFFTVCAGNALHLFRPEEIELLVRGSDEPLDIESLRSVAVYAGFGANPVRDRMVNWFWDFFSRATPKDQRKILSFITGSDRIPATGAANLIMKVTLLGNDCKRYPVAHTCYNQLGLYRYPTQKMFEVKFWRAVVDSQGFGLK
ncbi:putative E3 ubiquitin-protein ligase [Ascosphaera aggregata]|nr:putative E3 ubiquitin-protein ligase [Ascosphaera aggregata]